MDYLFSILLQFTSLMSFFFIIYSNLIEYLCNSMEQMLRGERIKINCGRKRQYKIIEKIS